MKLGKFEQQKQKQLGMKDNSSIGKWDKKISKLCSKLNKSSEYYTSSSCSGRVILIKVQEKKQKGLFLYRNHSKITLASLKNELDKARKMEKGLIDFRLEPCIIHVACNTLTGAQVLLDKAKLVGWKNSGIIASRKRIFLEARSTEHIEFPIINHGEILVDDKFLKLIVKEANRKLERTWGKIDNLERLI